MEIRWYSGWLKLISFMHVFPAGMLLGFISNPAGNKSNNHKKITNEPGYKIWKSRRKTFMDIVQADMATS
jgi:hypothetical protein